ncbi:MAG: nucleotidyltransferase domain-containing protein [Thermomicrobiales bacterium]
MTARTQPATGNTAYPGNARHQRVLRAVTAHYTDDPRILAVALFGSLARGTWDDHSDLDLDVVLADGIHIDPVPELERLCATLAPLGEHPAIIVADGPDEGHLVLESLLGLSIRYHPLATTSPNIVDSLHLLWGRISEADIRAAGSARSAPPPARDLLARCVREALAIDIQLQRGDLWWTIECLHALRGHLLALFARTHGDGRPLATFRAQASAALQTQLGATLPHHSLASARAAFKAALDLLENGLPALTNGQATLTPAEQTLLRQIRERQTRLEREH